ncbi:Retrovirus-related Pol polyprotein from transposon RE2 [Vitis vinifera]|uniref:Retrovirus-related Pol polyprotein from transposon RE2 n=1 Tax=Vitis vinifera TaxID=29760 RepID=A0A438IF13_VITVI|nr:Retrovirus-related Pol polyprotein from transposon RE2 [Vitis vinifera]
MATENSQIIIPNAQEPTKPLTMITIHNSIKLTPTNYLSWKTQMEAILIGYDLQKFIDGSHPAPPTTITTNNVVSTNPAYQTWLRQDKLLFGALVGTLSSTLVPLITQSKPLMKAWQILANTYARHLVAISSNSKTILKTSPKVLSPLQTTCSPLKPGPDELVALGKPLDQEDLIEKVLEGLDENYQSIIDAVNGRDSTISFDELHEKLINKELSLRNKISPSPLPASCSCHQCSLHSMVCHQSHSSAPWVHIRTHSRYHKKFSHQHPRQPFSCSSIPWSLPMVQYSRSCSLPLSSFPTTVSAGATTFSVPAIHHNLDHQLPGKLKQMLQPPFPPTPMAT